MASSADTLKLYYSNLLRIDAAHIPASDQQALAGLAAQIDANQITLADAVAAVTRMSIATTEVAALSYQFFTGATPSLAGLDYLVSPTGSNSANLNSAYYASFNAPNRYINFAVNLGKDGAGASAFSSGYGGLTLVQTFNKAYAEIFGFAPAAGQAEALLNEQVSNGQGGTFTRAEYLAFYGRDGLNGIGTKAALVGWLLGDAAAENLGAYATAYNAFAADVAPDGAAAFQTDLVDQYGATAGATITVAHNQSVSLIGSDPALRSTPADDHVTGTTGLDAVQSVSTGGGADVIEITGGVAGLIDAGAGADRITVDVLKAPVAVLGGGQNGAILAGDGDDFIEITSDLQPGAVVDAGAGYDALKLHNYSSGLGQIRGVEELILNGNAGFTGISGLRVAKMDAPAGTYVEWDNVPSGVLLGMRNTAQTALSATFVPGTVGADIHLDNVHGFPPGHITQSGWLGIIDATNIGVVGATGTFVVHVDSDSELGTLFTRDGDTIVVSGPGRLTAGVEIGRGNLATSTRLDASGSAGVDILRYSPQAGGFNDVILSAHDDRIQVDLQLQANASFTLGAGADTFLVNLTGPQFFGFGNLGVTADHVTSYARINDFQKGVDHVDLGARVTGVESLSAFVGGASILEQALINVSSHLSAQSIGVFEFGGDSWIYRQDDTVGVNAGDGLIRFIGVTGLSIGTGAAAGDIQWG